MQIICFKTSTVNEKNGTVSEGDQMMISKNHFSPACNHQTHADLIKDRSVPASYLWEKFGSSPWDQQKLFHFFQKTIYHKKLLVKVAKGRCILVEICTNCAEYCSAAHLTLEKISVFVWVIHKEMVSVKQAVKINCKENLLRRLKRLFDWIHCLS